MLESKSSQSSVSGSFASYYNPANKKQTNLQSYWGSEIGKK